MVASRPGRRPRRLSDLRSNPRSQGTLDRRCRRRSRHRMGARRGMSRARSVRRHRRHLDLRRGRLAASRRRRQAHDRANRRVLACRILENSSDGFFRRTPRRARCASVTDFPKSASMNGTAGSTACGVTSSSLSASWGTRAENLMRFVPQRLRLPGDTYNVRNGTLLSRRVRAPRAPRHPPTR